MAPHQVTKFRCYQCGFASWHPVDLRAGFCARCFQFTRHDKITETLPELIARDNLRRDDDGMDPEDRVD